MATTKRYEGDFMAELGDGDAAAAIRAGMMFAGPKVETINNIPFLITPAGVEWDKMEDLLPAPLRTKGEVSFEEPDSFCCYVAEFKSETTRLYGEIDKYAIVAIMDDHQKDDPHWREHKAGLQLRPSPEWNEWLEACGKLLTQKDLADFLDGHMEQIASPDAGDVLSDIRSVHISMNTRCESVQREGGDIAFSYTTETAAGTKTERGKIPSTLTLLIAPFRSWHPVQMIVRLEYMLTKEKELKFVMLAHQSERLLAASFNDVRTYVQNKLEAPVLV